MSTDFSTLEKLYTRGVIDINGKDYINGTNSNLQVGNQPEYFLPDQRFATVNAATIRQQLDRDVFNSSNISYTPNAISQEEIKENNTAEKKSKILNNSKKLIFNNITAGIIGSLALFFSGRYILKKLHILK